MPGRRVAEHRRERFHPTGPDQVWSLDFVADQLADGRRFQSLTVVDIYTRKCLAIKAAQGYERFSLTSAELNNACHVRGPDG